MPRLPRLTVPGTLVALLALSACAADGASDPADTFATGGATQAGAGGTTGPAGGGGTGGSANGGIPGTAATAGAGAGGGAPPAGGGGTAAGGAPPTGGEPATGGASGAGGATAAPPDLFHEFETVTVDPGGEVVGLCQSWTLGNDTPLYVHSVTAANRGAFHHSNWIWVPDDQYPGPDGTWKCTDRNFDQILAGAVGGVFFAQSTQSLSDTQEFPPGAAFLVPAHARLIGDVHLMNPSAEPATTSISLAVDTIPEAEVTAKLQPLAYTNLALDIAPATKTSARMQCAVPQPDFDVYYVLPHFHVLGTALRVDVAGGPMNGSNLFTTKGNYGESLGQVMNPPLHVSGSSGLVVTCDYDNPRAQTVRYGTGDQEMCVVLVYATGKKAGGEAISNLTVTDVGGVHQTDGLCISVGAP